VGQSLPLHAWKSTPYTSPASASPTTQIGEGGSAVYSKAAEAMSALIEGNQRFVSGDIAGKPTAYPFLAALSGGEGIATTESLSDISDEDPMAIVVTGSEVALPAESIFDAVPGSLIVQRSMCNIAGRPGGTLFSSLEYAVQKWGPKLLVVMGESHSSVIEESFNQLAGKKPPSTAQSSIISRVMISTLRAQQQMPDASTSAGRDNQMRQTAVELNALYTIECLMTSPIIAKAVKEDGLELHGAVLDCTSGKVKFLGEHPMKAELAK